MVGIAQLTHLKVRNGGKNPKTEGGGIFGPTEDRSKNPVELLYNYTW